MTRTDTRADLGTRVADQSERSAYRHRNKGRHRNKARIKCVRLIMDQKYLWCEALRDSWLFAFV
jgi:hypothetical protein